MKYLIFVLTIFAGNNTFAENNYLGISAGFCLTDVTNNGFRSDFYSQNRSGYSVSFTYLHKLNQNFSCEIDLNYSQRGYKTYYVMRNEFGSVIDSVLYDLKYNYIHIPIKFGIASKKNFFVFSNVGLCPSVFINGSAESFPSNGKKDLEAPNIDLSGLIEVGFGLCTKTNYIIHASTGYQYSFTSISVVGHHEIICLSLGVKILISAKNNSR